MLWGIVIQFIIFVLSKFRAKSISSTPFNRMNEYYNWHLKKLTKFLLEIVTFETSANSVECDKFVVGGRCLMYVMKSWFPRIDPGEGPFLIVSQFEKFWVLLCDFILLFVLCVSESEPFCSYHLNTIKWEIHNKIYDLHRKGFC
jgi:hypothetical protein